MCGRYTFVPNPSFVQDYEIENADFEFLPSYNIVPGQQMAVITMNSPKRLQSMKWGLVPFWAKDDSFAFKTFNARAEEIEKKPSFREPFKKRRCLIPSTGFYEWDKKGEKKIPYLFKLKEREVFCFAGLYDVWKNEEGKEIYSYTILTIRANGVVGEIHDRMPVILARKDEEIWADNTQYDVSRLKSLLEPYSDKEMGID